MQRRTRTVALAASIAVLAAGGALVALTTPRPACATAGQVLGVVPGDRPHASGPLPERAMRAVRAVHASGGYEGVWLERGAIFVGVHGPAWSTARSAATAVASLPGPRITYVCEPATERELLATQTALTRSPLWKQGLIGFSGIDVRSAKVTVALADRAPAASEAQLVAALGSNVRITRSKDPGVDLGPTTGRMPLASDDPQ